MEVLRATKLLPELGIEPGPPQIQGPVKVKVQYAIH